MKSIPLIYFILVIFYTGAYADLSDSYLQWSPLGKVTYIKPIQSTSNASDGWIQVQTKLNSDGSHGEYWLNGNTAPGKNILSVLLTAQSTGADVKIFYHKTSLYNFYGDNLHPIYSVSIETP